MGVQGIDQYIILKAFVSRRPEAMPQYNVLVWSFDGHVGFPDLRDVFVLQNLY